MLRLENSYHNIGNGYTSGLIPADVHAEYRLESPDGAFCHMYCGWSDNYGQPVGHNILIGIVGASCTIREDWRVVDGTHDDGDTDHTVMTVTLDGNDVLTATNGGNLLAIANQFKDYFFGGETQTAASLFDWMVRKYSAFDGFWCPMYIGTTQDPIRDPYSRAARWSDIDIKYGKVSANLGQGYSNNYPSEWIFSGDTYPAVTIPSELTGNDVQKYLIAALIFDENLTPEQEAELHFDVYVDGTKDPNVSVKWHSENISLINPPFSFLLVTPKVWEYPHFILDVNDSDAIWTVDGIVQPAEQMWYVNKNVYKWDLGSYNRPYLSAFNNIASSKSTVERIALWGVDGIANMMYYYLRFEILEWTGDASVTKWGKLFCVKVPREVASLADIAVVEIDNSEKEPPFKTFVHVSLGKPSGDEDDDPPTYPEDDPDPDPPPYQPYEPVGFSGNCVLTKTYSMDSHKLENVGSKLWTQSYFDVLKVQSNPIENIISCKWFPFSRSGTQKDIVVGNVNFGLQAGEVDTLYTITIGSYTYRAKNPSAPTFLDYSPYTKLRLHLPYCGDVDIDASYVINRKITVKYDIDLVTGDCCARIILDDYCQYLSVAGNCGVDIPLTATDRAQVGIKTASTVMSAAAGVGIGAATGNPIAIAGGAISAATSLSNIAGADLTSQRTASHSPACTSKENRAVYLEIARPSFQLSDGFKSRHGYPCHKFMTLSSFQETGKDSYVQCDERTKINFAMTSRENELLESLLVGGVYV